MTFEHMKAEILRLIDAFKAYEGLLEQTELQPHVLAQDSELMTLFASMYHLMQSPVFFEVVFHEGFTQSGRQWHFALPIAPLLGTLYRFTRLMNKEYDPKTCQAYTEYQKLFSCTEKEWYPTVAEYDRGAIDSFSADALKKEDKNKGFLALLRIDLRFGPDRNALESLFQRLESCTIPQATALVFLCDGTFTECLFLIKEDVDKPITILVATRDGIHASHIHEFTKKMAQTYHATIIPCPGITVLHDGDCSVYSELNLSTVLYSPKSVYTTLDSLRKGELSLSKFHVHYDRIAPHNTSAAKPDIPTLARLWSCIAHIATFIGAEGWFDFCKANEIHPKHIIYTYRGTSRKNYPHWYTGTKVLKHIEGFKNALVQLEKPPLHNAQQTGLSNLQFMKKEMQNLVTQFKTHQDSLSGQSLAMIIQNKEVMAIFASLYSLMQWEYFFEVLLEEGFIKSTVAGIENYWDLASPIVPLYAAFFEFLSHIPNYGHSFKLDKSPKLCVCLEQQWSGTRSNMDKEFDRLIKINACNEVYLGLHTFDMRDNNAVDQFETIFKTLQSTTAPATALVTIFNGTYTEPLCFLKNGETIELILSTKSYGGNAYVHSPTQKFIDKYKVKVIFSPNMHVNHDGDCSAYTELHLNAVLYEAALNRNHSVYNTLDALKKEKINLNNHRVNLSTLVPNNTSPDQPSSITLARLLAELNYVSLVTGGMGWLDFCKKRGIHPRHIVKAPYYEWQTIPQYGLLVGKKTLDAIPELQEALSQRPAVKPPVSNVLMDPNSSEPMQNSSTSGQKPLEAEPQQTPQKKNQRTPGHMDFIQLIQLLKEKMADFKKNDRFHEDPKLREAYHSAKSLYKDLKQQGRIFFTVAPTPLAYVRFQFNCHQAINHARQVLDHHRGWKTILLHIVAFIASMGIGYGLALSIDVAINGRCTLFSTDSSKRLNKISDHINNESSKMVTGASSKK